MFTRRCIGQCCAPVVAALSMGFSPSVTQADLWTRGGATNLWSNNLNWQDGSQPTINDSAVFPTPIPAGASTITMPNGALAASVLFNDSYTLTGPVGSSNLALGPAGIITVQPGKIGTLSVPLTANANVLTINGTGTLIMNNASARTANVNINNAVVHLNNAAALGTGPVNVSPNGTGGIFELGGGLNFVTNVNLQPNGGLRASGGQGIFGGTVNVSPSTTVNLFGGTIGTDTLRFGNAGPNTYTNGTNTTSIVQGPGTVYFLNSNDYAGHWQINSGTLKVGNANSLGSGTSAVVINNTGTLLLDSVTFSRNVQLNNGANLAFTGGQSFGTHTIASGALVGLTMRSTFTEMIGIAPNSITGGGGGSTINVNCDAPGGVIQLFQPSDYIGPWFINSTATVEIDEDAVFGNAANLVSLNSAVLRTNSSFSSARTLFISGSTLEQTNGSTLTLAAGIGGGSGVTTKMGNGTLILAANSARTGTIDIASGTLIAKTSGALGSTAVNLTLGQPTLQIDNVAVANALTMQNGSTLQGAGVASATGSLAITASGTAAISTSLSTDTFSLTGVISGAGSQLNVNGPGTVILAGSAANTHSGLTSVNEGTLRLAKTSGNAIATNVSIGDGSGTDVLVNDAPEQIANGNVNVFSPSATWNLGPFTETIGTVTMSGGNIITNGVGTIILNGGVASGITTFSSTTTANITANINLNGQLRGLNVQNGTANPDLIINGVISNGSLGKSNSGSVVLTGPASNTFTGPIQINAGTLTLAKFDPGIIALPGDVTLGTQGAATLRLDQSEQIADTASLFMGSAGTFDLQSATETINNLNMTGGNITGTGTLILNGNLTTTTAATSAAISTTVNLNAGSRTFSVADGTAISDLAISGTVRNGTLNKTGAGLLALSGGGPSSHQNLTINLNAGGLTINQTQRLTALNITTGLTATMIANGNRVLSTDTLSIAPSSRVDLNDNDLVVNNGSYTQIRTWVQSGFGNPANSGITSSTATGNQILALFDNALVGREAWLGVPVFPNAIVGKYTYFGDVNIDGQVTGDDYTIIDANLNTTPPTGVEWLRGDANRDNAVTGDDYTVVDANLGSGVGNPLVPAHLISAIPEPLTLPLLAATLALLARRTRRSIACTGA
jgi:fibronectin-binding autotransporter adhesin